MNIGKQELWIQWVTIDKEITQMIPEKIWKNMEDIPAAMFVKIN
jgi:hypothetical protein